MLYVNDSGTNLLCYDSETRLAGNFITCHRFCSEILNTTFLNLTLKY